MPSAFSIAAGLTLIIFLARLARRGSFAGGLRPVLGRWIYWVLLEFGMQMCLMLVAGYLLASSPGGSKRLLSHS